MTHFGRSYGKDDLKMIYRIFLLNYFWNFLLSQYVSCFNLTVQPIFIQSFDGLISLEKKENMEMSN